MNQLKRILLLEQKQPQNQTCMPLDFFYGEPASLVRLIPGLTLEDFYNQHRKTNG